MSELEVPQPPATPPPPPPPPPAGPASPPSYDFVKPLGFVFQDPNWVNRILIGGLFYLAAFFLVGIFFVMGYCARLARNVVAGLDQPLPEWDDLGAYFSEGLRLFAVVLVYLLPFLALFLAFVVPAAVMAGSESKVLENLSGGIFTCLWCLMFPLGMALSFWLPGAMLFCALEQRFGAAFEFSRIARFSRANIGNYLLAWIVAFVARFAAGAGVMLFCIGVIFTAFWAMLVATYAFAQTYRLASAETK